MQIDRAFCLLMQRFIHYFCPFSGTSHRIIGLGSFLLQNTALFRPMFGRICDRDAKQWSICLFSRAFSKCVYMKLGARELHFSRSLCAKVASCPILIPMREQPNSSVKCKLLIQIWYSERNSAGRPKKRAKWQNGKISNRLISLIHPVKI
jgi:hypothetical protein